ncbi:MAG: hypothetical protein ACOYLT_05515 [Flavobacterium sp.]|uniref:hypothetical protein n=1 Tax=Flavobacterium sp. TaxID=239 RepID=UPI003BCA2EE2
MSIFDSSSTTPIVINFSSKDRVGGTNSNFISKPIDLGINKYDSVCLIQSSIPRSFYNIPTNYNTFRISEPTGSKNFLVTIPVGSYNKINLASVLATTMTAASLASGNGWTYTCSYPSALVGDTFKYTFAVSGNATQPSFIFTTAMFRQMGFEENTTYAFTSSSLVSVNCINLAYITRAFIKSNVCLNAQDGILEEILNYGSYPMLSLAYYQQVAFDLNTRTYNDSAINSWSFTLVDSFDQIIDLNGIPWSFSLVFYKRNDTHELHKNELLISNEERLFKIMEEQTKVKEQIASVSEPQPTFQQIAPSYTSSTAEMLQPIFEQQPYGLSETIFQLPTIPTIETKPNP